MNFLWRGSCSGLLMALLGCISVCTANPVAWVIFNPADAIAIDTLNISQPLPRRSLVASGDRLVTTKGCLYLRFNRNEQLVIHPSSQLTIYHQNGNKDEPTTVLALARGSLRLIAHSPIANQHYQIKTSLAELWLFGGAHEVSVGDDYLAVNSYRGHARISTATAAMRLGAQEAFSFARVTAPDLGLTGLLEPLYSNKRPC